MFCIREYYFLLGDARAENYRFHINTKDKCQARIVLGGKTTDFLGEMHATVIDDIQQALANKNNSKFQITHKNNVMKLRSGKYYELN